MENLFLRLIKYRPREDITPIENFITELFCGILEKVPAFKEMVLKYIFKKLNGDPLIVDLDWKIFTQFYLGKHGIADIAFKNNNEILLIEHKVDSFPEDDQLENYHKYLDKNNGVGLILLTKRYSIDYKKKNEYKSPFQVIFWHEIVDEMEKIIKENKLKEPELRYLKDFYYFLEEEGMRMKKTFEPIDFITMQNARSVFELMDKIIEGSAKKELKNLIKPRKLTEGPRTQLRDYGRYIYWGYLNKDEDIEIIIGFFIEQDKESFNIFFGEDISQKGYPIAYISIGGDPNAKDRKRIISFCEEFAEKNEKWKILNNKSSKWWDIVFCSLSLKDLVSKDHIKEINNWWIERIDELKEFLKDNKLEKN